MTQTKKKVSINVMHILKSIMDYRVKPLRDAADAGRRATMEESEICASISSLQHFINNSRYDRSDTMEAQAELDEYERQASAIRKKIERGTIAMQELKYADKFYATYNAACKQVQNQATLQHLLAQKSDLENRLATLERDMDACEINMTPGIYSPDVVAQAESDMVHYNNEYTRLSARLNIITSTINSYQH